MSTLTRLFPIGTRVRTAQGDGVVVGGTVWTANEKDGGDRTVKMDGTGERLHFESFLMTAIPLTWTKIVGRTGTRILQFTADSVVNEMCDIKVWRLVSTSVRDGQPVVIVNNGEYDIEVYRVAEGSEL